MNISIEIPLEVAGEKKLFGAGGGIQLRPPRSDFSKKFFFFIFCMRQSSCDQGKEEERLMLQQMQALAHKQVHNVPISLSLSLSLSLFRHLYLCLLSLLPRWLPFRRPGHA